MKALKILLAFSLLLTFSMANGQSSSFQRNRRAFQKERYKKPNKKYSKACSIFEKRRIKGEKQPLIRLGIFKRKSSKKVAEQG